MKSTSPEQQLIRARELFFSDTDGAIRMYRELVKTLPVGPFWAAAHIDLARHEYGTTNFESALRLTKAVLDAGVQVEPAAHALAGILQCLTFEMLDVDVDEVALARWIDDAVSANHLRTASGGTALLSRRALLRNERLRARILMERTLSLSDEGGSILAAAGTLQRLALLDLDEGDIGEARRHLERALEWLRKLPYPGMSGSLLEKKIRAKLEELAPKP